VSGLRAAALLVSAIQIHLLHLVGIYFHILSTMHGQNHIEFIRQILWTKVGILHIALI
jgi:hypothetical protein